MTQVSAPRQGKSVPSLVFPPTDESPPTQLQLEPFQFDAKAAAWRPVSSYQDFIEKRSLRLVTYNVWFSTLQMEHRFRCILDILKSLDADIICLQEVLPSFIALTIAQPWVQKDYFVSDVSGQTLDGYGVIILSRIPIYNLSMWTLPTRMGRALLVAEYNLNGEKVSIGTVHLESLDSADLRRRQLELISPILGKVPHAALTGDFNFDSDRNFREDGLPLENRSLKDFFEEYSDVWPTLRPNEKGYTYDSKANAVIKKYEQMRYDRILWKSENSKWVPTEIKLFGTEPLSSLTTQDLYPSDHFGLVADFNFTEETEQAKIED